MKVVVKTIVFFVLILVFAVPSFAQEQVNYNTYYKFIISVGAEYQMLSPFADYKSTFNVFDVGAHVRYPIPPIPFLQPSLFGGIIQFDSQDQDNPDTWDHTHFYGGLAVVMAHRFAKNFEIGGEIAGGYSYAYFRNLVPDEGTVGSQHLFAQLGAKICLNPSYNISIEVHPNVKYIGSLITDFTDFNGFIFGIGFGAHFRVGKDPDAAQATIRSLRFDTAAVNPLFAAMQSYYTKNPIGTLVITNTEKQAITDVEVSFFQPGFMDSPTPAATFSEINGGETREIDLFASYNQEVFRTEGITPLTGEIITTYKLRGRPAEQRKSVSYDLHDKTAVTWDDDRKVAAFITPADSALRNYSSFIRQLFKEDQIPGLSDPLQFGMQAFNALTEIGCLYQIDPSSPFTEVQDNPMIVDSISLPRDTLKRITGDCDDLTVLYCSLLETVGIETAFITVPGHIYAAFNSKVPVNDYKKIHSDRNLFIGVDGNLWIPVEITMIGKTGFMEAWRKGIEEYTMYDNEPGKRGFYRTAEAQQLYRPVGLKEADLGLQYGSTENIVAGYQRDMDKLVGNVLQEYEEAARNSQNKKDYNKLGIANAQFKQYGKAEKAFETALSLDSDYLSAWVNLGNIRYLRRNYDEALSTFLSAVKTLEKQGRAGSPTALKLFLNVSKAYYALENFNEADEYYAKAAAIDSDQVKQYSYLASTDGGDARAADVAAEVDMLFIDEEE